MSFKKVPLKLTLIQLFAQFQAHLCWQKRRREKAGGVGADKDSTASFHDRISLAWARVCPFLGSCITGCRCLYVFGMIVAIIGLEKKCCSTCLHWKSSIELALNALVSRNALESLGRKLLVSLTALFLYQIFL